MQSKLFLLFLFFLTTTFLYSQFTDIGAIIPGVVNGSVAWGDFDNDGYLDFIICGETTGGYITRIYRNNYGVFTDINAGLPGIGRSSVAWADFVSQPQTNRVQKGIEGWGGRIF